MIDYAKCKSNLPHDMTNLADFVNAQYKQCVKCGYKHKFNKDSKGRIDNLDYLNVCIAETCQPTGRTKAVYHKVYHPQLTVIRICLSNSCNGKNFCIHKVGARTELRIDNRIKGSNGMTQWDAGY